MKNGFRASVANNACRSVLIILAMSAGGCGSTVAEVENAKKEAAAARAAQIAAETNQKEAEAARSNWQMATGAAVVAAIALLVFGTAAGSKARKDAQAKKG